MKILIVEQNAAAAERFTGTFESVFEDLEFPIDLRITTVDRFDRVPSDCSLAIFGPALGYDAVALAARFQERYDSVSILLIVDDHALAQGGFYANSSGRPFAVGPASEAAPRIRAELERVQRAEEQPSEAHQVIYDRYEVVRSLGTGGHAEAFLCRHRDLDGQLVVVKVLSPLMTQDEPARERFRKEIVATYAVNHPHVVRTYEYFSDQTHCGYSMEYVDGGTVIDLVERHGKCPFPEAVRLLLEAGDGLAAIHRAGLLHRDLGVRNILLTKQRELKISDFACATRPSGAPHISLSLPSSAIDSMAPEFLEGQGYDVRSDLYSLGVLGFFLLTGTVPFSASSTIERLTLKLRSEAPAVRSLRPDCPPDLDALVARALMRDAAERFQSAAEFIEALKKLLPIR